MRTKNIIRILCLSLGVVITGCDRFLNLDPQDQLTEVIYFKTPEHFQEAANKLHTDVWAWKGNDTYGLHFDAGSDLVRSAEEIGSGTLVAGISDKYWEEAYKWLRTVNQLIEKGQEYPNEEEIAGSVGQAYFFRAWHHFFLLKRFGGVPIAYKVTDVKDDIVWGPRRSRYEVIKFVIDDLDVAIRKLSNTTVESTKNDGHVTLEAAKALKARVALFAGTWDKYVGTKTDGDGIETGAGSFKPDGYPSVSEFLTMARNLSKEIIDSQKFELWMGVEDVSSKPVGNPDFYAHKSYFYLFNLEGSDSNPAGLTKSSNKEAIYRGVYDRTWRKSDTNLTHTAPAGITRKLHDMYLCSDGLPIHVSPLFKGFTDLNAEYENRDYRLTACVIKPLDLGWGWGTYNSGAQYDVDIYSLSYATYQFVLDLRNGGSGMPAGRKFCSESNEITSPGQEAMDYYFIRLPEMYLTYAEAVCELGGGEISDSDLDYSLNKVRARGGVAPLNKALISQAAGLGCVLTPLGEIRRERALELYGEGHRITDLCRWGIAEKELAGQPRCGVYLSYEGEDSYLTTLNHPTDGKPVYEPSTYVGLINDKEIVYEYSGLTPTKAGAVIIEQASNRKFSQKNYLYPIPTNQIVFNPELKQNPGY